MSRNYWIIIGVCALLLAFFGHVIYERLLKGIPGAAQRFGKSWGTTTDRFTALRYMNTFFYVTGMIVTILGIFIAVVSVTKSKTTIQIAPIPQVRIDQSDGSLDANEVLQQVNVERQVRKIGKLTSDPRLTAVAEERIRDMVTNQYYAHQNMAGEYFYDLFAQRGFATNYGCENLDIEFTLSESQYVQDWLNSTKGHRECMLNKKVSLAGYAVGTFTDAPKGTSTASSYIVVGIHAESPLRPIAPTQ